MMNDLIDALPGLGFVGLAVGVVAVARLVFGDRPDADEHDLSDYREAAPVNTAPRSLTRWEQADRKADDILPPAPPGMNAGSPLYAETLFRSWHPESPDQAAARILRELRDEALAGAR